MATDEPRDRLRQRLSSPELMAVITPEETDRLVADIGDLEMHQDTLRRLAEHYNLPVQKFKDLLLVRQVLLLHLWTDYAKPGNELTLQSLLKTQHQRIHQDVERHYKTLYAIDIALQDAHLLHKRVEAVLAQLQRKTTEAKPGSGK